MSLDMQDRVLTTTVAAALILLAVGVILLYCCESRTERLCLLGGVVAYYVSYYFLFEAAGLAYSLSAVNREEFLTRFLAKGMAVSGFSLLLATPAMVVAWRKHPNWHGAWRLASALAAMVALTLGAQIDRLYLPNGLTIVDRIFNLTMAFHAYLLLLALVALPFAMLLSAPLLVADGRNKRKI